MFLCVGLGNPGLSYVRTRHNVGWMALDGLLEELSFLKGPTMKFQGALWEGRLGGERLFCLKPMTYMNLSGRAVRQVADYYGIEDARVLILYDDRAIPLGTLRIRAKGSAGGHNGMASIIACMGSPEIPRCRIGIGPLPDKIPLRRFVLAPFSKDEEKELGEVFERVFQGISLWVSQGIERAMNRVNG